MCKIRHLAAGSSDLRDAANDKKSETLKSFISEAELLARIPISRRTLFDWRRAGKIPYVAVAGRRILFHWPSVEQALLRRQTGGQER
jgi:hypothetical protein